MAVVDVKLFLAFSSRFSRVSALNSLERLPCVWCGRNSVLDPRVGFKGKAPSLKSDVPGPDSGTEGPDNNAVCPVAVNPPIWLNLSLSSFAVEISGSIECPPMFDARKSVTGLGAEAEKFGALNFQLSGTAGVSLV